jgi:hypothetical protein
MQAERKGEEVWINEREEDKRAGRENEDGKEWKEGMKKM